MKGNKGVTSSKVPLPFVTSQQSTSISVCTIFLFVDRIEEYFWDHVTFTVCSGQ